MSSYLIRPRIREKKVSTSATPVDPLAAEKILSRFKSKEIVKKPDPYRPIENFEYYASSRLKVAKEKFAIAKKDYKYAVQNLRECRYKNLPIYDALRILHRAMADLETFDIKKEEEKIEKMRELQEIHKVEHPPKVEKPSFPNVDMNHVYVSLKVQKKSKNVKVKLSTPLLELHEKYYKNLKRPPIVEKIRVYSKIGYPEWYLEKMLNAHEKQMKKKKEIEKLIVDVFTKYDAKKPSKSKPKTTLQKLK